MPTYDYRCPNDHEFEVIHGMGDPGPAACEICGASPVTRVFRPVPIFFKGSGFYTTDYGRKKRKVEAASGDGDAKKADSGTKSEEKASKAADG